MSKPGMNGFSLLEMLLALSLGSLLLTAILQLVLSINGALATGLAMGEVQSRLLVATEALAAMARPAGSVADPWQSGRVWPVEGSIEGAHGPELVLRQATPVNCLGNRNPIRTVSGEPQAFLRVSRWQLLPGNRLAETCHYGPLGTPGTRQLASATRVEGVEAFAVLFALDSNDDGLADDWVKAGNWPSGSRILGIRYALLLASSFSVGAASPSELTLLGDEVPVPDDGRIRRVLEQTIAFEVIRS